MFGAFIVQSFDEKKINKLIKKINNFLDKTECGTLRIVGEQLSVADCDSLLAYIEAIKNHNVNLMEPLGGIRKVLEKEGGVIF